MILKVKYDDPPSGTVKALDITDYLIRCTWSGDSEQMPRKLELEIAYNSVIKDSCFLNLDLKLGGRITLTYVDNFGQSTDIFSGRIFYRKRNTNSYNFNITAYDDLIYLAKNKLCLTFYNAGVSEALKNVCSKIGVDMADNQPQLCTLVNFIADEKSGSVLIIMLLEKETAATGKKYMATSVNGKLSVVERGQVIKDFVASDLINVTESEHGEGYESMINRVEIWNENGDYLKSISADDDLKEFGLLQTIYKIKPPVEGESVDNIKAATALLHSVDSESQIKALGNIQCITGYSIHVSEEQLHGTFLIKSDSHIFENNTHIMSLALGYVESEESNEKRR